jgi:gamma-F420-2:alpha-L-glutamate ligase
MRPQTYFDVSSYGGARFVRCWLFFHHDVDSDHPEAPETHRFQIAAEQLGIELEVLKPQEFDLVVDRAGEWSATYGDRPLRKPDLIIPRTGSETTYFMLAVLRHFERQGVAMANGPAAIESVADKLETLQVLSAAGIPIPKTILGKFPVDVDLVERELGFPVVVKTLRGTRGTGVLLCSGRAQFRDLTTLLDGSHAAAEFIFQEYIRQSHGRDVRVLVVNGKAIAAMERRATDGGFKSNISQGGQGLAFEMPSAMARLAVRTAAALNLDVAGVDILFDNDDYKICEVNSSPGFQGLERACAIDVPRCIFHAMIDRYGSSRRGSIGSWRDTAARVRRFVVSHSNTGLARRAHLRALLPVQQRHDP